MKPFARKLPGILRSASQIAVAALVLAVAAGQAVAQSNGVAPDSASLARPALFRSRDLVYIAALGAAVAATMPADERVERSFQRPSMQNNSGLRNFFRATGYLGDPGSVILSMALYFGGLGFHSRAVAALGMHTGESVVLAGVTSETLKGAIGRARPKSSPTDSRLFRSGKGFSSDDFASMPSTETSAAFAAAGAIARGVKREWSSHATAVSIVAYSGATAVAASRLYKNEHWASDVVGGAGIGLLSAGFVDRFNRRYPNNLAERWFLPQSILPKRNGLAVAWNIAAR